MLVEKDHVGGKGSCGCCNMVNYCKNKIFAPMKFGFAQNGLPSVRSQHKLQQTICLLAVYLFQLTLMREKTYVKVTSKKYFVEVLLNIFPQQYYYYYHHYYYYIPLPGKMPAPPADLKPLNPQTALPEAFFEKNKKTYHNRHSQRRLFLVIIFYHNSQNPLL